MTQARMGWLQVAVKKHFSPVWSWYLEVTRFLYYL